MSGSSVAADGTGGTAVPYRRPPRCLPTSGSMQGTGIPQSEQQNVLRSQNYRYQPRDVVVREHYQQQGAQRPRAAGAAGQLT